MNIDNDRTASVHSLCSGTSIQEECGIFGVFGMMDAAHHVVLGLHSLQHRGHDSAGVVSTDGRNMYAQRRFGRVGDRFDRPKMLESLNGNSAIGHVRYTTSGDRRSANIQPIVVELETGTLAIAHNGHLTNAVDLRRSLIKGGAIFQGNVDSEVISHLIARSGAGSLENRLIEALHQLEGAYSLVMQTPTALIGIRDPVGIRPLVIGDLHGSPILASESCAMDMIGATLKRPVKNGEIVIFDQSGERSIFPFPPRPERMCIFEYIYFSRPDSILEGHSVYSFRKKFGCELARECPAPDSDIVVAIPDSGVPAAMGYASQAGIRYEQGIIRNHYVGRTFIEPRQTIRDMGVRLKHNVIRPIVQGKSIVLVDDSIVRGTTSTKIVAMLRACGARKIHLRIACPQIRYTDCYGIDTPHIEQLIAATHSQSKMQHELGVDSLGFLSIDGLYRALGHSGRNPDSPQYADHCFTGDYPTTCQGAAVRPSHPDPDVSTLQTEEAINNQS